MKRLALLFVFILVACGGPSSHKARWPSDHTPLSPSGAVASAPVVDPPMLPSVEAAPIAEAAAAPTVASAAAAAAPQAGAAAQTPATKRAAAQLAAFPVFTDPGELPSLVVAKPGVPARERPALPLKKTSVVARLSEVVAEVEVTQRFENTQSEPIEAIYVFPLPENAAVNRMKMTVGERVIEARIDERQRARQTYETAKRQGKTAALLEEERANVFTQSVANIEPGKAIEISIRYVQDLSFDAGVYEFVFPMVVGPRFMGGAKPGEPGAVSPGGLRSPQPPTIVADAARISPPYVGKGERSGHDISVEVIAEPALATSDFVAVTHKVTSRKDDEGVIHLTLADGDTIPNRDFVLRYRGDGDKPRGTLLTSEESGFFTLIVDPPSLDVDTLVGRREVVFVVDISGSMSGTPLVLCKAAMRQALAKLRPVDTFNVITFAGATAKAFPGARPANDANVKAALGFVEEMRAGGGTMMLDAVATALSPDVEKGRDRYVFFLTDGFVGADEQIVASTRAFVADMEKKGQRAKVFGFGVGSSPNRALLDGLSREGKGVAVYASTRDDPGRGVNQFFRYIDKSVLRDVSIDWGGAKVDQTLPAELPDLFASHPLIVHGKLGGLPSRPPVLHATSATGAVELPIQVVPAKKSLRREVLGALWARSKIAALDVDLASGDASAKESITALGIRYGLVTHFTSFIAVDSKSQVGDGKPTRVEQALDGPEDVDLDAAGGRLMSQPTVSFSSGPVPERDAPSAGDVRPYERAQLSSRGCACRAGAAEPGADWRLALPLLALAALRARRRGRGHSRLRK